jgi:hypothetical protein
MRQQFVLAYSLSIYLLLLFAHICSVFYVLVCFRQTRSWSKSFLDTICISNLLTIAHNCSLLLISALFKRASKKHASRANESKSEHQSRSEFRTFTFFKEKTGMLCQIKVGFVELEVHLLSTHIKFTRYRSCHLRCSCIRNTLFLYGELTQRFICSMSIYNLF